LKVRFAMNTRRDSDSGDLRRCCAQPSEFLPELNRDRSASRPKSCHEAPDGWRVLRSTSSRSPHDAWCSEFPSSSRQCKVPLHQNHTARVVVRRDRSPTQNPRLRGRRERSPSLLWSLPEGRWPPFRSEPTLQNRKDPCQEIDAEKEVNRRNLKISYNYRGNWIETLSQMRRRDLGVWPERS